MIKTIDRTGQTLVRRVCMYCHAVLGWRWMRISAWLVGRDTHGACGPCFERVMAEIERTS